MAFSANCETGMNEADAGCAIDIHTSRHELASVLFPIDGGINDADSNTAGASDWNVDSDIIVVRAEDQAGEMIVVAWRRGIMVLAKSDENKIRAGADVQIVFK